MHTSADKKLADMELDILADMEVDKVGDKVANMVADIVDDHKNKLAKLRRHASQVSFGSKKFGPN